MNKLKKLMIVLFIVMVLNILCFYITSKATEEYKATIDTNLEKIEIKSDYKILELDDELILDIYVGGENITSFSTYLNYNEAKFKKVQIEDLETIDDWTVFIDESDDIGERVLISANDNSYAVTNQKIGSIKFKVKEEFGKTDLDFNYVEITNTLWESNLNEEDYTLPDTSIEIEGNNTEEEELGDIYLKSREYKIGEKEITRYKKGDKYISRVGKETTLKAFKEKLITNGKIKVLKMDNTELADTELVGTGMKLVVTKENVATVIEIKIVVTGDLDGNGKVTATDLSAINQAVLKVKPLENEYFMAADTDENNKLTATDLSTINQMVLKLM